MASIISAGTSTGSALNMTGDTSGALALATNNGTTAVTINTSQNVGVGTASPSRRLHVSSTEIVAGIIQSTHAANYSMLRFLDGTNTVDGSAAGIGSVGTSLALYANGGEKVRITSDGNVGIGTSSPGHKLDVNGSTSRIAQGTTGHVYTLITNTGGDLYMGIDRSTGGGLFSGALAYASAIGNGASTALHFATSNTVRTTITSGGELCVGATAANNGEKLFVSGSVADNIVRMYNSNGVPYGLYIRYSGAAPNDTGKEFIFCNDTATTRFAVRSNGGIANYSGNNVNLSDAREKTNVELAGGYLNKICNIPVKTFNYIDQNLEEDGGLTLGVVAQDVQAVAPELVNESDWSTEKDGSKMRLSIYQTDLQYALMKSIQELKVIVDAQAVEIAALKTQVGA
jgi:hypothetical protein